MNKKKAICFLPNLMKFKIERTSENMFTVVYEEEYNYIPKELLETVIQGTVNALERAGVKGYRKTEKGIEIRYSGSLFQILAVILTDILTYTKQIDFDELTSLMKTIRTARHKNKKFVGKWNKEIEKELSELGKELLRNPFTV